MTPLVLLPGMMCDARLFGPQIDALAGRGPVQVLPIGGARSMAELARIALDAAPPRFALAGLSMGGIVAMEMVRQAPERVDRLALLDTNPLAEDEARKRLRGPQIDKVRQGGLAEVIRDEMKPNYLAEGPDRARILALCMDMALALGPEVFVRQVVGAARPARSMRYLAPLCRPGAGALRGRGRAVPGGAAPADARASARQHACHHRGCCPSAHAGEAGGDDRRPPRMAGGVTMKTTKPPRHADAPGVGAPAPAGHSARRCDPLGAARPAASRPIQRGQR